MDEKKEEMMDKGIDASAAAQKPAVLDRKKLEKALKVLHAAKEEALKKLIDKASLN